MTKTANLTAKDLFNASSSSMSLEKATDLTLSGAAVDTIIDTETGEEKEVAYLFTSDGVYGSVSATVLSTMSKLIELIDEIGELEIEVLHRESKSGRTFLSLYIK